MSWIMKQPMIKSPKSLRHTYICMQERFGMIRVYMQGIGRKWPLTMSSGTPIRRITTWCATIAVLVRQKVVAFFRKLPRRDIRRQYESYMAYKSYTKYHMMK